MILIFFFLSGICGCRQLRASVTASGIHGANAGTGHGMQGRGQPA